MLEKIKNCFEKDPVNSGRQKEIDIAKGIALIFMTLSHSIEILGWFFDPSISTAISWHDFDMVIKAIASVFFFCMGISLCYSKKQSSGDLFRRAIGMAGLALLLETARTVVPCFIEWLIFGDFGSIRYAHQIFCVDALQFASMTLLVMSLFKKLKFKPWVMLLISVACSVIGQLLAGVSTGSKALNFVTGFLWHSHAISYFPLLNWLIIPMLGYAFGYLWIRLKDRSTFFKLVTPISFGITVLYFVSMVLVGEWYYLSGGIYAGLGLLDAVPMFVLFLFLIGLSYYLTGLGQRFAWLESMGARVNSVYCIHWTIYAFLYLALRCTVGESYVPMWAVVPVGILVLAVANIISKFYKNNIKNNL